jgi:alkanesulfonate monooxygenase SsuD/methylene tetrahydromethanopterin reductase-like flavin-dependent oxidoreductase (luciferase family)
LEAAVAYFNAVAALSPAVLAPMDRLAYCALIYVADTPALAREGAQKLMWYMHSNKVATQYQNPPGYHPPAISAQMLRGNASKRNEATVDDQIARGNVFAGTPDQVYQQIKSFWEYSGGFGHLLMMGQAGFLTPEETKRSMYLFGQEVFPRLKALNAGYDEGRMQELRAATPDVAIAPIAGLSVDFVR